MWCNFFHVTPEMLVSETFVVHRVDLPLSYLRRIDSCITHLKAQGPSRTCNESEEEEEEDHRVPHELVRLQTPMARGRST